MEALFLTNRNFMRWAPIFSYLKIKVMYHGPKYYCTIHTTCYLFESTYTNNNDNNINDDNSNNNTNNTDDNKNNDNDDNNSNDIYHI